MAADEIHPVPETKKLSRRGEIQLAMVRAAFLKHIKENQAVPTIQDVCEAVGLSKRQVHRYLKEFDWKDSHGEMFRAFTPEVMVSLLAAAKKGNVPAIRTWMEIVESFSFRPANVQEFQFGATSLVKPTIYLEALPTHQLNGNNDETKE